MIKMMKIIDAIRKYDGHITQDESKFCYYIHLNLPGIGKCLYIYCCPFARTIGEDDPDDREIKNHMLYSNINIKF